MPQQIRRRAAGGETGAHLGVRAGDGLLRLCERRGRQIARPLNRGERGQRLLMLTLPQIEHFGGAEFKTLHKFVSLRAVSPSLPPGEPPSTRRKEPRRSRCPRWLISACNSLECRERLQRVGIAAQGVGALT